MKLSGRSRYSGYTLVEILVVIAIIGLIVGVSLSAFSILQQKTEDKATQVRINTISLELESLLREFPDDEYNDLINDANGGPDSTIELYKILTGDVNLDGVIDPDDDEAVQPLSEKLLPPKPENVMTAADWMLTSVWITEDFQIKDAFGTPLRLVLRSNNGFVGDRNDSPVAFDLWSAGQDRMTANSAIGANDEQKDDVGNW